MKDRSADDVMKLCLTVLNKVSWTIDPQATLWNYV